MGLLFLAYMSHLGIDPGTKNIGVAVTDDNGKLLFFEVMGLEKCAGYDGVCRRITTLCQTYKIQTAAIERFVPFKGIFSKASEDIILLIGWLCCTLFTYGINVHLYRSIEWKPALCKYLVKTTGFDNPSSSFDKVFSKAAAIQITKEKVTNDHVADAIDLSHMWRVHNENK